MAVIVTKDGRNGNRYYLHEAVDQDGNIIYGNEKKTGAASDRPAQKVRDTIAVSDLDSNIISDPDEKSNGKFSIPTGSDMVDATRLRQENAYAGRSMTEDREIYSYDFLTALPDMQVTRLPEIDRIRNDAGQIVKADVVAEGMKNARSVGTERDGKVFVRNAYTGKNVLVTVNSIRHGLNGGLNRQLTNARLGAVIGDVVRNAVPINALNNKANGVNGTYAMAAYATDSKGREFVAIVTVEQYSGNISGLEAYDVTHAVSGRQKNGSPADTKSQGFYPSTATTISIANLIENVNRTHQSILSDDVLARLGDERDPGGFYTGQVRYSMPGTTQLDLEVKRILSERGDKTDDEIRLEINQAVDRVYQGYVETYGAMQPGEKPAREVQVPKKTGENEKVSQTVRTILEAKATPEETLPDIQRLVAQGDFSYEAYTDKQALADAEHTITGKGWQQSYADWRAEVRQGKVSKENTATGWVLYNNAVNEGDTALAMDILQDMVRHQRSAAQAVQATRILKKLSPESQLYNAQRSVQNLQEELKEKYGKNAPELKISEQLAADFLNAETEEARDAAMEALYKDIGRQMPSNWMDKWTAWRYVAMLGNPRTHIRNIVGNAGFMPVVKAKNAVAAAAETAVDKLSGGKAFAGERGGRSKALGRDKRLQEAARADYDHVVDQIMAGGKYQDFAQDNAIEAGRVIFKFKPLEKFRTANGAALELEDAWFARKHYTAALASYCRANGITEEQVRAGKGIDQARAYAIREAQKATYRDANDFSQMVSDLGRYSGDNQKKKVLSTLVEGVLPFRKTPANILARGVEYSPLGLVKSLTYDLARVAQGKKTTAEMLDGFASGLTGTGLLALGFFLAGEGLIRGAGAGDDDEKKFADLTGHQDYALEAWGYSVTLDWLAPEALPFFVGVNLQEQLSEKEAGENLTMADYGEALQNITEPLLEMSCLQSLNDLFESVGYAAENGLWSTIASAATSYVTQALPTLFGQIERTTEEKRMTTYTEKSKWLTGDVQYALGRASTRFPLDYDQIPYIDAWGREETTGGVLYRAVNNFLNPAYVSKINESSMEQELQRLYDATGDSGVVPKRPEKTITVNKKEVDLTGEEYVKLSTIQGQTAYVLVGTIVESEGYQAMDDTDKAEYIKDAYTYARAYGKSRVSDYTPDGWVAKAMETTEKTGMDPAVYIYARQKTKGIESLTDSDGDSIPNSKGLQTMEAVYAIPGLKEEQRKALFSDFGVGKSVIHYNKAAVAEALGKMRG